MGLFNSLRNQLIDIIQWTDDTQDTLVWRFPRYENEIKNGAQLIVRESQVAAFVLQGQLADVFQPGTYTLHTQNLPILSTRAGWKYGFESPCKAEVYFVSTRTFTDRKWGTQNPIMMRDPEFGPVRVRAFGSFVAGDQVIVGVILFSILVVIQFVVITQGATRISEVAARFMLDGLPGRQMAIDADLHAGLIDQHEAHRRRDAVYRQADFFGAMDGAGKFVRGDAVAGGP